ncbi:MAG: competence/damage-inducible protein A [Imperialibacter sp.]|uniref:competence/damage-inducible protein A n=2 Tax=Imperialibacter TaxID=1649461 RepID=UPI003A87E785
MHINAEILSIGDEILYGQIHDTNSTWIGQQLSERGIKVIRKTTVGDVENEMMTAFAEAEKRADIIIITGGLGPTKDDLTKPLLARYFGMELALHEEALAEITALFEKRGFQMTDTNRQQAWLPKGSTKLTNRMGTAPGMWFEKGNKTFVSLPGVPYEMKVLISEQVIPRLREKYTLPVIYHKMIRTIGIGESWLSDKIEWWETSLPPHIKLAYLPSPGEVKLRLTGAGPNLETLAKEVQAEIDRVMPDIQKFVYGYDQETIESAIGKLLLERKLTVSTAESCTGGYLAHEITSIPGSSAYYMGSIISYDNRVKTDELGVKQETLDTVGAVSEETVRQMAEGVRKRLKTDIGLATSGIAGPDGGTPDKPVGTVWIACAFEGRTFARKLQLTTDRQINIHASALHSLNLLRTSLMEMEAISK